MATHRADSTLDLPLEVAELIIDESALAGDKDTLRNICLASKRYTTRCQQHLFHTIDLGDRCIPGGLYYRRLRSLLVRFPELGKLVRDLRLVDTYVWDSEKEANWGWLIVEENLAAILAALPNLAAFSLRFNAETPAWPSFAAPLRHALIQLAQRPKMHAFALNRIARFPPSLLVTLVASVRRLELIDVAVQEFSPAAPLEVLLGVAAIATPVVVSLTLRAPKAGMLHVLRTILAAAPLPTLCRLRVAAVDHADGAAALELWSLLHWGARTITQIEWLPAVRPLTAATCAFLSISPSFKYPSTHSPARADRLCHPHAPRLSTIPRQLPRARPGIPAPSPRACTGRVGLALPPARHRVHVCAPDGARRAPARLGRARRRARHERVRWRARCRVRRA